MLFTNEETLLVLTPAPFVNTTVAVPPETVTLYVIPLLVVVPVAAFTSEIIEPSTLITSEPPFKMLLTVKVSEVIVELIFPGNNYSEEQKKPLSSSADPLLLVRDKSMTKKLLDASLFFKVKERNLKRCFL